MLNCLSLSHRSNKYHYLSLVLNLLSNLLAFIGCRKSINCSNFLENLATKTCENNLSFSLSLSISGNEWCFYLFRRNSSEQEVCANNGITWGTAAHLFNIMNSFTSRVSAKDAIPEDQNSTYSWYISKMALGVIGRRGAYAMVCHGMLSL